MSNPAATDHLRFAGLPPAEQQAALIDIIRADALLMPALDLARAMALPGWWLVAGALYQTVWNRLTDRPPGHGIKDVDLIYFDGSDLGYDAEDAVIRAGAKTFAGLPVPVEIRNQARVHLWFERRFGAAFSPLESAAESLDRYASIAHAVAARLEPDGGLTIAAPFGLDDIFAMRLRPNRALANGPSHQAKAARMLALWPELTVEPW